VVDPGGEPQRIAKALSEEGIRLEAIFATHGHFDHIEGVKGLHDLTGAKVYCSQYIVPVLSGAQPCDATGYPISGVEAASIEVVEDARVVEVGRFQVLTIATPGHTPGDLTFEIGGHLFCGDLLFRQSIGRTDFPGGDFDTLIGSVAKLAKMFPKNTPVHPGHMGSTALGDELATNPFLIGMKIDD
jgi:glyoxylase-like metal-dependent hydrolase (beta-lactamase superfamily II)